MEDVIFWLFLTGYSLDFSRVCNCC